MNDLYNLLWSVAITDGERVYDLDHLRKVFPQLLAPFDQLLFSGKGALLLNILFKIAWKNLILDKRACQWDSHVPKGPLSEGEVWECSDESYPKDLSTPFPMRQVLVLYVK